MVVDHQLRYNPYIQKIKELIDNNEIGQIYSVKLKQQGTGFANQTANWCWSFDGSVVSESRWKNNKRLCHINECNREK